MARRSIRWLALISAILASSISDAADADDAAEPRPIIIGLLLNSGEPERTSMFRGATLGIESAYAMFGRRARVIERGRPGQWGVEADDAAALALDEGAAGIIAPPGGAPSHQALQVAGRTQVPVVSLCPDSSITAAGIPWAFRIVPRTDEEAGAIFSSLPTSANPHRCAAILPGERAGREVQGDLMRAAEASGVLLEPVMRMPSDSGELELMCQTLAATEPDVILLWNSPAVAGHLARSLRAAGFKGVLAGPAILRSKTFLHAAGAAAEGFVIPAIAPSLESEEKLREFVEAFQNRFGVEPDSTAAMTHDAVLLLVRLAIKRGNRPVRGLSQEDQFHGVTGAMRFDATGSRVITLTVTVRKSGQRNSFRPEAGTPARN